MSRARKRRLPVLRVLVVFGLGGVWAVACGGPQPLGAAGAVCFRADECQAGLACIPETPAATKQVCSAELGGIVSMVDGAPLEDGETPDAAGGGPAAAQGGSSYATAGAGGKPSVGGAPGAGGEATTSGGSVSAGGPAGGSSPDAENGGA